MMRHLRLLITIVIALGIGIIPAFADMQVLLKDMRFCPSWAEAHERTLASLNKGRPPYPVKWKGCVFVKKGTKVDIVDHEDESTEVLLKGKHWFADE